MATISQIETEAPRAPSPADIALGMTALRMCRAVLEPLPTPVMGATVAALVAEFVARWPEHAHGQILRSLLQQSHEALIEMIRRGAVDTVGADNDGR